MIITAIYIPFCGMQIIFSIKYIKHIIEISIFYFDKFYTGIDTIYYI